MSADPARSAVERLTNGIDGVLELEHERHGGLPDCRSPLEAAVAWLGVPERGLSAMTPVQRRALAQRVSIKMEAGEGRESRIVEVRDRGIGITPQDMPKTILSLNESNKLQKHYLAGAYGQGGSTTFSFCRYTLVASRYKDHPVGFTIVKFLDLPPEEYKIGHYVYLVLQGGELPEAALNVQEFPEGTQVRHFGYDLTSYSSPLGPNSVYGSLNTTLFDPIMPIWFDNRVHDYRRVIKGSRNALNGATDDGDEKTTGPALSHSTPMFNVSLGDFGRIGIEYWVLEQPTKANKKPNEAFVNRGKPIALTLNGQNQGEFSQLLVRKEAELPFLTTRLIGHIDCNNLSPTSKRQLFVSSRESQHEVKVREMIQQEMVKALKSDDVLAKLNDEARQKGMQERDETAIQQMQSEVARLLKIHGVDMDQTTGGDTRGAGTTTERPVNPPKPRPKPAPIELHEPPTYIHFVWDEEHPIAFYAEQRRYLRIVTDANSTYHNPNNPSASRINLVVGDQLLLRRSTALIGGRMRAIVEGSNTDQVGHTGVLRIELTRPGLTVLVDERPYRIVAVPEAKPADQKVTLPPFRLEPISPGSPAWTDLSWPDNVALIASEVEMESGVLVIRYSTAFPKFANQRASIENRDVALAESFTKRYAIWLAVHSLLHFQDEQKAAAQQEGSRKEEDSEMADENEKRERVRIAVMSSLFAAREVQMEPEAIAAAEM